MTTSAEWLQMADKQDEQARKMRALADAARADGNKQSQISYEKQASDCSRIARQNRELANS